MSFGKEILSILLFLLVFSGEACCRYRCSNKPDGQCSRCDCVPDCFDLSDEIDCTNGDVNVQARFFPPPPLPPFKLCHDIVSTTEPGVTAPTSIVPPSTPPSHTKTERQWTLSSSTTLRALLPSSTEVSTTSLISEKTTFPQWLCSEYNRFYHFYCRYPNILSGYCTKVVTALKTCADVRPAVSPTTTTTPAPPSYPMINFPLDYHNDFYGTHYDYDYFIFK